MIQIDLVGKRALVCGASGGIGEATARVFAQAGAEVILLARTEEKLAEIKKSLPGQGHQTLVCDLSKSEDLKNQILKITSSGPVHILVNNAGGPSAGPLLQANARDLLSAFETHLIAAQTLASLLVPGMQKARYGRILNIISTSVKAPIPNLGVSNTIRGAMASWAKTLATELARDGITVNNILPGYTRTARLENLMRVSAEKFNIPFAEVEKNWQESVPAGRFAEASEVAATLAFLASPLASYVNGINVPVDGGKTPAL